MWIQRLAGVSHFAMVSRNPPEALVRSTHCWIVPLPNVVWPTSVPRLVSWRAPATISLADALPLLTSTMTRMAASVAMPPGAAAVSICVPSALCSQKIGPLLMNWLAIVRAAVT